MSGTELLKKLQIELYRVVDYDSQWYTKYNKDCNLDIFNFTFKMSFHDFYNFQNSIRAMSGSQLLQHSNLNCTV